MSLLSALGLVCGLMLHVSLSALNTHYCVPRKTVPYQSKSQRKPRGVILHFRMIGLNKADDLISDELAVNTA